MALTYSAVSKVRRSQFVLVVSSAGAQAEPKPAAQPFHEGSPVALAAAPEVLLNSLLATAAVAKSEWASHGVVITAGTCGIVM